VFFCLIASNFNKIELIAELIAKPSGTLCTAWQFLKNAGLAHTLLAKPRVLQLAQIEME